MERGVSRLLLSLWCSCSRRIAQNIAFSPIANAPSHSFSVAHPALVSVAKSVFNNYMPMPNQIDKNPGLAGKDVTEADLLKLRVVPKGKAITSDGLQKG